MTIPTKTWSQYVSDMTAQWGAGIQQTPVLSPGDFLLALFEAVAGQDIFLQAQILQVLALTRASTSTGADLDTWMADFNFFRLQATFATGPVQLSALTPPPNAITVAAATLVNGVYQGGMLVQTTGGGIVFQVIPDTTQSAYQQSSNVYILPAGQSTITVTVQAVVGGSSSNVVAGAINQIGSQQAGISTVLNQVPIQNGVDAESDTSFRARFILYLGTLSKATRSAILAAALSVQQGLQIGLVENQNPQGAAQNGTFTVYVDNGTGAPGNALLASVFAAVDETRAFTVQAYVAVPQITNVTISLALRLASTVTIGTIGPLVSEAILELVESLATGDTLYISAIENAALGAADGIIAVQPGQTLINGTNQDLVPNSTAEIRTTSNNITVDTY